MQPFTSEECGRSLSPNATRWDYVNVGLSRAASMCFIHDVIDDVIEAHATCRQGSHILSATRHRTTGWGPQ